MKRNPLPLVLLVLSLLLISCDGSSPTSPLTAHTATLTGVVADAYGSVWGGVTIGIVSPEGVVADGGTNDQGRYTIRRIPPGHYKIWLQLGRTGPGYFASELNLHEGENTLDIVTR